MGSEPDLKRPSVQRTLLGILLALGGVLLVGGMALLLMADLWLRKEYEPALGALRKDTLESIGFFCEQQALLGEDPWFHEPRTEGDAGPLLNAWMAWEGEEGFPTHSPLFIPNALPQISADFEDWLTSKVDVSTLEFSWMARLHAYDRWELLKNRRTPPREPFNLVTDPSPVFDGLILWARFRLLHGLRTGQPLAAARDVRQLAWLTLRTDLPVGAMIAFSLLDAERAAHASMQAPPPEWRPMSREQVARMKAIVMTGSVFSHLSVPVEVAKKSRRCGEAVTRCNAMAEAAFSAKFVEPLARRAYREEYTAFEEDRAAFPCPTSLGQTIWEHGATANHTYNLAAWQPEWVRWLPRVHFGSRIAGRLLAEGSPNLDDLHAFRKALTTGTFDTKR